ncbi:MAG: site-2 protease family protein [Proteobacteria bacterium]|nr:site-2 protease family protein [Pseudomonadota bacterium]MDA1324162.1 site-2 protease family protein [Pseudomonadota bacterium]
MGETLYNASIWVLPVLIAITFHEAAHGYVAWRLGDDTAKNLNRVTFNPLRHVDLNGTIIVPSLLFFVPQLMGLQAPFLFGWAKPVPVNFMNLNNPRRDMVWVAAAGPGINLVLAIVSATLLHVAYYTPGPFGVWLEYMLKASVMINVVLAVFNMLPIPPLDGGRVAVGLLPRPLAVQLARLERVGLLIVLLLLVCEFMLDIRILSWLIGVPREYVLRFIMFLTGHS